MKHMKKIIITLALFCLTTTTTTAYADSTEINTDSISENSPVEQVMTYTEEEKAFLLKTPEMAMNIRHFIDTLRSKSGFNGTAIIIKNDIVIHKSGQLRDLAKSPDMALHYEANMNDETTHEIGNYEWVDTVNGLEHSFELEGKDGGPLVFSKRNFDNNTTVLIVSNDPSQDALAFASEIEDQLN